MPTRSSTKARSAARLGKEFYRQDPQAVAQQLLGKTLVHVMNGVRLAGWIVETEAYLGIKDRAAHSFGGRRTRRTETMYQDGGTVYVYLNYGIHHLFNVVTDGPEVPTAVLVRALEPSEGLETMFERRRQACQATDLASGPGKLGQALGIGLQHDGLDLTTSPNLFIEDTNYESSSWSLTESGSRKPAASFRIRRSPRIGVDYAQAWARRRLRYFIADNPHVSCRRSVP